MWWATRYELLMELFMDYDSDEFEVIETCVIVLKYTITHTIRYTDGLGGDPDASLSILGGYCAHQ